MKKVYKKTEKIKEYRKLYNKTLSGKLLSKFATLKYKYGISPEEYIKMLVAQGGRCLICNSELVDGRETHIDHDHRCCNGVKCCGKCIRGILCHFCNRMLGDAKDNIKILESAINYLKQHE